MEQSIKKPTGIRLARLILIAVALGTTSMPAFSQTTQEVLQNLAGQIAMLQARTERLNTQISQTQQQYNDRVQSLSAQIADVEVQINREEIRLRQIQQDLETARAAIAEAQGAVTDVEPIVLNALTRYRTYVENALPFQVEERLSQIDDLERIVNDGNVPAQTMLTRVWNTVENEYRLSEESGLFRQTINLAGEDQLAEVARLGMVLLYFRTFDDRYGYAVPASEGDWQFQLAVNREEAGQVAAIFEALRRNLREGFFTLPNPYRDGLTR
jgi:hypothetical protein